MFSDGTEIFDWIKKQGYSKIITSYSVWSFGENYMCDRIGIYLYKN